jgi:lipopolysaccharide export LptBFGC system permease protein LptF
MTLLDRSIARQFLFNVVSLFAILFALIVIIDFSLNFDEYLLIGRRIAGEGSGSLRVAATTAWIVFDLWWPRLFQLYGYLLGLVLVGAMGFTCAQMVKNREMVAILAGGMSLWRVARPMLAVALVFCGVLALNREVILPSLAHMLTRDKKQAGESDLNAMGQPLCADGRGNLFYIRSFNPETGIADGLYAWERDEAGLLTRRIAADSAIYRGNGWVLTNGTAQVRQERGTALTPVDFLPTDLDPTSLKLRRFEGFGNNLSSAQLAEVVRRHAQQPKPPTARIEQLTRARWSRISDILCVMLTLVICLPFFLRREPANMLVQALCCAPVAILAMVGAIVGSAAGVPGVPPELSSFLPAMVLLPIAIAAASGVRS